MVGIILPGIFREKICETVLKTTMLAPINQYTKNKYGKINKQLKLHLNAGHPNYSKLDREGTLSNSYQNPSCV